MSIIKSNGADISAYLDQIRSDYFVARSDTATKNMEQKKDNHGIPIKINDMVWILPDFMHDKSVNIGRVSKINDKYITIALGRWALDGKPRYIRKLPMKLLVVSVVEV